ncbi:MAG: Plug domain-containing protein [Gemmatimonadales bacterium]
MKRCARLGFAVGAFFFGVPVVAVSQVVVPPGSEVPIPPKEKPDSTKAKADTIKAVFGRSAGPHTADIGPQYEWNRDEMFSSGAHTLADLLARLPEATSFTSNWLASPKFVATNGDLNRVKIIYDGVELDNVDPRSGALLDLTTIDLAFLEHVMIERFANELRVHVRSWRVDRTDPSTRTDIYTGDEDTNIYRGFYGKRFSNGAGLQLGGQQYNTRSARLGGGGDALSFMGRFGIARRMWSIDAFGTRRNGSRVLQPTFGSGLSLPPFAGTHTLAYVRAAVGDQAGGPWAEVIASYMRLGETSQHFTAAEAASRKILPDTTDTTTHRAQYVASLGYARGPLRLSVADRIRAFDGDIKHAPYARLEVANKIGLVGFYGEHDATQQRNRGDLVARFTPKPFLAFAGAASTDSPEGESDVVAGVPSLRRPKTLSFRGEAGVRLVNPWVIAGIVSRDTAVLIPPSVFDTAYSVRYVGRRQGLYAGLRGKLYKDINVDVVGTRWDSAGFYQPRYQARSEINLNTRWLSRFPSGSFGLKLAYIHEYRGEIAFPTATGTRVTNASGIMSALVEIRILRGVASYQVRNFIGDQYQIVPDFFMPRSIGVYGIRWEFWN